MAQMVKRLPTMWETLVWSLGGEDPLEKEMATHYSTLAWKIAWMEKPGRLQSMGLQRVGQDWVTSLSLFRNDFWENYCKTDFNQLRNNLNNYGNSKHCWWTIKTKLETGLTRYTINAAHPNNITNKNWEEKMTKKG